MASQYHRPRQSSYIADRLIDWHDEAITAGRTERARRLLEMAWTVLESSAVFPRASPTGDAAARPSPER